MVKFKNYERKLANDNGSWVGSKFGGKPPGCAGCRYQNVGAGFIPDRLEPDSKLIFCVPKPSSADEDDLLMGNSGTTRTIIDNLLVRLAAEGIPFETEMSRTSRSPLPYWIGVSGAIRCLPPSVKRGDRHVRVFPEGMEGKSAIRGCATFDDSLVNIDGFLEPKGGLRTLAPKAYMITLDPGAYHEQAAFRSIIDSDVFAAAKHYLETGDRTAIMFGPNVYLPVLPTLAGGAKAWRGSLLKAPAGGWSRAHYGGLEAEAAMPLRNTVRKADKAFTYTSKDAIKEKKVKAAGKKPKQLSLF